MRISIQQSVGLAFVVALFASPAAALDLDDPNPSIQLAGLASKLKHNLMNQAMCSDCTLAIKLSKIVSEVSEGAFISVLKSICKSEGNMVDEVCEHLTETQGPVFVQAIKDIDSDGYEAHLMCATIGGLCPYPAVPDYSVTFPKPRPANTDPPALSGQVKTLLHLSDIHVDPLYAPGTDANCNFPICCRDFKNLTKPDRPASKWGDYSCDAPVALLDNLLDSIPKFEPKIDYALITGDIAPHDVWVATESSVTTVLKTVYASISKHFTAYNITKVFPSVGNHDTAPVNLFPLKSQSRASDWVYHTLADSWKQANWLPDSTILEVADYGTYATRPEPGLKVISLNTNLCYVNDWWIYGKVNELDPNGMFAFLVSQLQASEDAGERVWITAHVPPGISDCFRNFAHFYYQIIQRYSPHVIVAQFYGHTHRDEFEIFYSDETKRNADTAISVGYVTPSVVPMKNTNSAFRIYKVDAVSFQVVDSISYHTDISQARAWEANNTAPVWTKTYSAREVYGSPSDPPGGALDAKWWHRVTERFEADDALFQKYWNHRTSFSGLEGPCDATCKSSIICGMRAGKSELACLRTNPFSKRRLDGEEGRARLGRRVMREEEPLWARNLCAH